MVYFIGLAVITALVGIWLWNVLPKRVKVYDYDYSRGYAGVKTWNGKRRWEFYFETWWTGMFGILGILLAWLAAAFLWALVLAGLQNWLQADFKLDSQRDTNLVALNTGDKLIGKFFLASGYITDEQTFSFLSQEEDGGINLEEVYAYEATVYEDEQDQPFVTTFTWVKYDPWISPFGANLDFTYAFHIPEGSIVSGYEVAP